MTEHPTSDAAGPSLKIRQSPRPTTRINRKVLMLGAGLGALALLTIVSLAMTPQQATAAKAGPELYNTLHTQKPEALSALPATYSETEDKRPSYPRLGQPLAGDFGASQLQTERAAGIERDYTTRFEDDFRPDPVDEAKRAEQLRQAALAQDAAAAPVFFKLQSNIAAPASSQNRGTEAGPSFGLASELMALNAARPNGLGPASPDTNLQRRKLGFAEGTARSDIYNPGKVQDPLSPYQIMAGTLIPASLITGINSDLPGSIIAQVTQPVYDTVTGRHVLVPQGSRLIGRYQSEVSLGQDRALVTWDRIIFPDGASIVISAPGADAQGFAGLADRTNNHWDRVFVAAGLATILGIGAELGAGDESDVERAIRRGASETISDAGQRAVDRNLGIQPTITVRPGWPVRVVVTRDLILRPYN